MAIVGPTGSGKSTIVQLIPRLYEAEQGELFRSTAFPSPPTPKSRFERKSPLCRKSRSFFSTPSRKTSPLAAPYTDEQIESAAKRRAQTISLASSERYKTPLSETGKNLSGGQQQRLAIARALVKEAPILIMDEATSSLDSISEDGIKRAINRLRGEVTQIIIAHRLSTIEDADKIIYLDHGQKIAEGTKEELLQRCREFRLMWEMLHSSNKIESTIP